MKYKKIQKYILILSLFVAASGCKSKKQIVHPSSTLKNKTSVALFTDILRNQPTFSTFSSKINLAIDSGTRSLSSKGNLKIEKGKAIQISVQPLFGVELFRFFINPDSMIVLDRMNKRFVKEALTDIKKEYPVGFDYYTLQALLSNQIFLASNSRVSVDDFKRFKYSEMPNSYYLKATDKISEIDYAFSVNGDDRITFSHLFDSKSKYNAQWNYNNFAVMDSIIFPTKMKIKAASEKRNLELDISFGDIKLNEILDLRASIPKNYSKVQLSDIIKVIVKD